MNAITNTAGTAVRRLFEIKLVRFGTLGVTNILLSLFLVWMFVRAGWGYGLAHTVAQIIVVSLAYVPSRSWVFRSQVGRLEGFFKFHLSYLLQLCVALAVLTFAIEVLDLSIVPAEALAMVVAVVVSFSTQQLLFRKGSSAKAV